jgi:LysR family hydrogen peroxide-inducible transcriptional activator
MNIRNLEYLVALAKYRHFQRAAEACNVSQPTLSAQLRKLENELGLQLLERTTRKSASQTGLRLVEQTQVVLREIEALKNMAAAAISRVCHKRWISALFQPWRPTCFPT